MNTFAGLNEVTPMGRRLYLLSLVALAFLFVLVSMLQNPGVAFIAALVVSAWTIYLAAARDLDITGTSALSWRFRLFFGVVMGTITIELATGAGWVTAGGYGAVSSGLDMLGLVVGLVLLLTPTAHTPFLVLRRRVQS